METISETRGLARSSRRGHGQAARLATSYTALMMWTLFKTVGTFSIFMDIHPLPNSQPGPIHGRKRGDAKAISTMSRMVSAPSSPVSEHSLCSDLIEREI